MTMDVEIFETKEFLKAVKAMKLAGGRKSKAADQVLASGTPDGDEGLAAGPPSQDVSYS
jgi:hypothetical protein